MEKIKSANLYFLVSSGTYHIGERRYGKGSKFQSLCGQVVKENTQTEMPIEFEENKFSDQRCGRCNQLLEKNYRDVFKAITLRLDVAEVLLERLQQVSTEDMSEEVKG